MDVVTYALSKKFTKKYVDEHSAIGWDKVKVNELPDPSEADPNTVYFVPNDPEVENSPCREYILMDGVFEEIGSSDLTSVGFSVDSEDDDLLILDTTPAEEDPEV